MSTAIDRRIQWRCRRGMLELDWVLQKFLERRYHDLTTTERQHFERLLALPDQLLLAILQQRQTAPDNDLKLLVEKIV